MKKNADPTTAALTSAIRAAVCTALSARSGLFIAVALTYPGGLQGTGDTKSPLYISVVSQIFVPLSIVFVIRQTGTLAPMDIWLAILVGHMTRCGLSAWRFRQGKWRSIKVELVH